MFSKVYHQATDKIGDFNPQLFREIKGRLTPRNITIVTTLSLISQTILFFCYKIQVIEAQYCRKYTRYCELDLQLWWFDIFITMSVIGIFALLVIGSYMLSADLLKEKRRGTLNFISLTPTSATNIFIGKILGVPILLYLFGFLALPFHFLAGLMAKIPLLLILSFYLVLAVSCIFFYSLAILPSLIDTSNNASSAQQWLVSIGIFFFLWIITILIADNYSSSSGNPFDLLIFFSPSSILLYLSKYTSINYHYSIPFESNLLDNLSFYTLNIWRNPWLGIGFILGNYSIWIYFIWQGLQRIYHNVNATVITKKNSYWFSLAFIFIIIGFTFNINPQRNYGLKDIFIVHFTILLIFNLILFVSLIFALTPKRQTLQDWSRYHHQNTPQKYNRFKDLLFTEKSPAVLALTFNIMFVTIYSLISVLIFPLDFKYKIGFLIGLVFLATMSIVFALMIQLVRMRFKNKKNLYFAELLFILISIPILLIISFSPIILVENSIFGMMLLQGKSLQYILLGFLGQITAIALLNFQLKKSLKKMGMSETARLLKESQKV